MWQHFTTPLRQHSVVADAHPKGGPRNIKLRSMYQAVGAVVDGDIFVAVARWCDPRRASDHGTYFPVLPVDRFRVAPSDLNVTWDDGHIPDSGLDALVKERVQDIVESLIDTQPQE